MELILRQSEFEHLPDKSVYNNNFYKHSQLGYIIKEEYNYYEFYLVENRNIIFIGCSSDGFNKNTEYLKINFKEQYT